MHALGAVGGRSILQATIALSKAVPVASGAIRDVYRHPGDPALLIKVVRSSTIDLKFGSGRRWHKLKKRRYRHLIGTLREVREQIALQAEGLAHPSFLQKIIGFVETDIGPGLVVNAVLGRDGDYAPTLGRLIQTGRYDDVAVQAFERFIDEVIASVVIIADLHPNNLVYAHTPERGYHFVMIDGIGFKTLIPIERISPKINAISNRYKLNMLRKRVAAETEAYASRASFVAPTASKNIRKTGLAALMPAAVLFDPNILGLALLFA